jgi:hypothetical protein
MGLGHSPSVVTNGLVFYYDMGNSQKSWKGAPTFNASLQDGQNDVNPWGGDGTPTPLGIDPTIRFRGRKVAKFRTGSNGNCYLNGAAKLSTGTTSTVWTSTFYLKRVDGTALSSVGMYLYVTGNTNVNLAVNVTAVEDGWYKAVYTRSGLVAGYPTLTGMFNLGASTEYFFADWQCENLNISTPWVKGTRTNTQALFDLTNNNNITATSLTYNAGNTFSFNGSNNAITIPTITPTSGVTFNSWIYIDGANANYGAIFSNWGTGGNAYFINTQNGLSSSINAYFNGSLRFTISSLPLNSWIMLTVTNNGTTAIGYINGIQQTSASSTLISATNVSSIGYDVSRGNFPFKGDISTAKIYNRALSAAEVQQNFNALRGRYGI